jgi:hypothetical protein
MDHAASIETGEAVYTYLVTPDEIKKLRDMGFRYVNTDFPETIMFAPNITGDLVDMVLIDTENLPSGRTREELENTLGYHVWCNEEEVIAFLVRNNIPFTACLDTGHSSLIYERDGRDVLEIANHGIRYHHYRRFAKGNKGIQQFIHEKTVQHRAIEEYLSTDSDE